MILNCVCKSPVSEESRIKRIDDTGVSYQIACPTCGRLGEFAKTKRQAVARWNEGVARELVLKELPTIPGYMIYRILGPVPDYWKDGREACDEYKRRARPFRQALTKLVKEGVVTKYPVGMQQWRFALKDEERE